MWIDLIDFWIFSSTSPMASPQILSLNIAPIEPRGSGSDDQKLKIVVRNKTSPAISMIGIYLRYAFCMDLQGKEMINLANDNRLPQYLHPCT